MVVTELAYRSVAHALLRVQEEHGVALRVVASPEWLLDPADVVSTVDERTRLVVVPHLPVFCGVPQPVAEIGRLLEDAPALVMVNATQSAGQLPIDVRGMRCDFLFGTSRKWLRGPRGLGFLYVRRACIERLRPMVAGYPAAQWTAPERYELATTVERFRAGDQAYTLLLGLAESVRYARSLGVEEIASRNRALGRQCREMLAAIPGVDLYDRANGVTGTVPLQRARHDGRRDGRSAGCPWHHHLRALRRERSVRLPAHEAPRPRSGFASLLQHRRRHPLPG